MLYFRYLEVTVVFEYCLLLLMTLLVICYSLDDTLALLSGYCCNFVFILVSCCFRALFALCIFLFSLRFDQFFECEDYVFNCGEFECICPFFKLCTLPLSYTVLLVLFSPSKSVFHIFRGFNFL